MKKSKYENIAASACLVSAFFTLIGGIAVIYHLPDMFTDLVLENYDGIDHYYNGSIAFIESFLFFLVSLVLFILFSKGMKK